MPRNSHEYILSSLDTVPASLPQAGQTVDSSGQYVTGTATLFKSDKTIVEGDWIFSPVNREVRRIERIMSDTSAYLDEAFSADLSGEDLYIVKASRAREISLANTGGADSTINKTRFTAGVTKTYAEEMMYRGAGRDFPDPVVIEGNLSDIEVLIIY